jgi:hypothetical protein
VNLDALFLGPPRFEAALRDGLPPATEHPRRPRALRALARPALADVFESCPPTVADRDRLIRDSHVRFGYRLAEIAAHLGLHPSTASLAVKRVEAAAMWASDQTAQDS